MDPDRFDNAVRALFIAPSRRAFSRGLTGLAFSAVLSVLSERRVGEAKGHRNKHNRVDEARRRHKKRKKKRPSPPPPSPLTPPPCRLDESRCGTGCCPNADTICRSWDCVNNQCVPTDAPETTPCGAPDGCHGDTFQAPGVCDGKGACAQPEPQICTDDGNPCTINFCHALDGCGAIPQQPDAPCGDGRVCCEGTCCPVGYTCCNGVCSCGACGNVCDSRFGTCCSGTCTVLFLDPNNCGVCGRRCGPAGSAGCCSGTCTYFGLSPNCGGCGRTCSAGQTCFGGVLGEGPFRCCKFRDATCTFNSDCCTQMCQSGRCL